MELVPAGSRMNPVSTPFVVVEARPSAVWWNHVESSFVRSELSNADRKLLSFIDTVTALGAPRWLATSAILLEGSAKTQHQYGRADEMVCKMSQRDGKEDTLALTTPNEMSVGER
ncbi:hypothetical protein AB0K68_36160 [Streptomyces sp. NPDC050698]